MAKNQIVNVKRALGTNGVVLIVAAALILEIISMIQYQYAKEEITVDLHLRAQSELLAKSLAIQSIMSQVESAVGNHVWDAERQLEYADSAYSVVKRLVEQNPDIIGSSFSFKPNYYPEKGYWFESYAVRRDSSDIQLMQLGGPDHDYTKADFFKIPYETGEARWTDPYLDSDGARMILTTFSEPIHDKEGNIVGVLDADISLDWLKDILSVNYIYPSSYPILISRSGQLMSYPDSEYVMHSTIEELASEKDDKTFRELSKKMMNGESGNIIFKDNDGDKYHIFFSPVGGDTGWSLAVVSSEKEIFSQFNNMKRNLLILRIIALAVLVFIIFRSIRNINKLQKITIERERIQGELTVAREIQMGMLPKNNPEDAEREGIDIYGNLDPAKEVGGDLYDFFIKEGYLYFCIGDVSGKGIPASMFMTVTRSLFRTIAPYTHNAAKVLWYMNRTLSNINETNMFVTFFVGILDLERGILNYANAGHNGPLIIDNSGVHMLKVIPNLSLGVFPDFFYEEEKTDFPPGSMMFLYTDGVTEAMNESHREYGEERMIKIIKNLWESDSDLSPEYLLKAINDDVKKFVDKAEQSDDLTMLAFKTPKKDLNTCKLELTNKIDSINVLNQFVDKFAIENGISDDSSLEIKLALEEAVVNIINYSYPPGKEGKIDIILNLKSNKLVVTIRDKGVEFDPTKPREVNIQASLEEREIGGLGIFLLNQLTDNVTYRRKDDTNILSIEKNIKYK